MRPMREMVARKTRRKSSVIETLLDGCSCSTVAALPHYLE
jgi:hypothetical protein